MSRAGFYRSLQETHPVENEMLVRAAIPQIARRSARHNGQVWRVSVRQCTGVRHAWSGLTAHCHQTSRLDPAVR